MENTNRIHLLTKFTAWLLGSVVFGAFVVLYFFPTRTAELFAWPIKPPMTAMFMGASYANGCVFFAAVLLQKKWHRIAAPHIGVFLFASFLLISTYLHWDKFSHSHPVCWAWVFIYAVAPVLVPLTILRNRAEDPGTMEESDAFVPLWLRLGWLIPGAVFIALAVWAFIQPTWLIAQWPWKASPLTMRVMISFYSMLGVAVCAVLRESRWTAWRVGVAGVFVWHLLVVLAAWIRSEDFTVAMFRHWWIYLELGLVCATGLTFAWMERKRITSTGKPQ